MIVSIDLSQEMLANGMLRHLLNPLRNVAGGMLWNPYDCIGIRLNLVRPLFQFFQLI